MEAVNYMLNVGCDFADCAPSEQAVGKVWAKDDPVGFTQWVKGTREEVWPPEAFSLATEFVSHEDPFQSRQR